MTEEMRGSKLDGAKERNKGIRREREREKLKRR